MKAIRLVIILLSALFVSTSVLADDIPDIHKTPGVYRRDLTTKKICEIKWGKDARHVTAAMKREAFSRYGYSGNNDPRCVPHGRQRCEIDHLISRELGGADVVDNLWPEAYGTTPWNAHLKDKLENRLHKEVCITKSITLKQARDMLVNDWRVAYRKYYGDPQPIQ